MSDKYIIKNCPAYSETQGVYWTCYEDNNKLLCQDCTDCVMKQIVEKCKNYKESCKIEGNCIDERLCSTCFLGGANELGEWILDDLEIEECE